MLLIQINHLFTYAVVYERGLIVQVQRLPFVGENCGKGISGRFPGPHCFIPVEK